MEKVQQVHKRTETDNDGRTVIHWSSLSMFCFFWAVSRRYAASSSTSPGCLYRLELHLVRLFLVYQQGFFLSADLFECFPRQSFSRLRSLLDRISRSRSYILWRFCRVGDGSFKLKPLAPWKTARNYSVYKHANQRKRDFLKKRTRKIFTVIMMSENSYDPSQSILMNLRGS